MIIKMMLFYFIKSDNADRGNDGMLSEICVDAVWFFFTTKKLKKKN